MPNVNKKMIGLIIFLVLIILAIGFILIKYVKAPKVSTGDSVAGRPPYLSASIPSVDKIENILENPKFKEMRYIQAFFEPVKVSEKGKVNPFLPFPKKEIKQP
ncbi:MAG: hypothetical protein PHE59_00365 [Patescibacteria group bacterium]|nr:hypothetical protein [Patescibacteria group bacterium]MDD5164307.1 hypothetical protein [Patescibacteria group bacterium]MDD5534753.1 hypothetical protein [Patescibacteria group bacterium]